jgi:hypothetical protein
MSFTPTATQLQQLRPGDRLKYHGVEWQVTDYSTYDDPQGYQTEEWLLQSAKNAEYYLLREVDPKKSQFVVNWYIAEEINNPHLFQPDSSENIIPSLWQDMQQQFMLYQELRLFNRSYYFESQTQGTYEGDEGETARITWDYWDQAHQWNLAIEAWENSELHVYLTKPVNSEAFSEIKKGTEFSRKKFPLFEVVSAVVVLIVGLLLMIFG